MRCGRIGCLASLLEWISYYKNFSTHRLFRAFDEINACAFKTVHLQEADRVDGTTELTPAVLDQMAAYNNVAPAHNPPYLELIRACQTHMLNTAMIGAFEFEFHRTMPPMPIAIVWPTNSANSGGYSVTVSMERHISIFPKEQQNSIRIEQRSR